MKSNYKSQEEFHYDNKARTKTKSRINYADFVTRTSRKLYFEEIVKAIQRKKNAVILDYGCGNGEKHFNFANKNVKITGIDISSKSIELANNYVHNNKINAEYMVMDCEKMDFDDNSFDIIADFGTFSSLEFSNIVPELIRVLKKDGEIICIETFGHNPFMIVKRLLNVAFGIRTKWAAQHIMRRKNWKALSRKFEYFEIKYFHFLVLFISPILKFSPKKIKDPLLTFFERLDTMLLQLKFLRFLAFKTVVILSKPIKQ